MPGRKPTENTTEELRKIAWEALTHGRELAAKNAELLQRLEALQKLVAAHEVELAHRRGQK
jgi:hypothetical protein